MTGSVQGGRGALLGWREYVIDMLKHLLALTLSFAAVFLAISGRSLFDGSSEALVGMLRLIGSLAVATLFGHGLVTRIRGHVSLVLSGFFTWIGFVAVFSLPMLGADSDAFVANFWLSLLVGFPIVILMTALRAFVPIFQVRPGGQRLRPWTPDA